MTRLFRLALLPALALAACNVAEPIPNGATPTVSLDPRTSKVDEQVGLTVTLAYTAASRAAALAIRAGVVKDKETIAHIGELDNVGFDATQKVRRAYDAQDILAFNAAVKEARAAANGLLAASGDN